MLAARVPLHCIFAPSGCGVGVPSPRAGPTKQSFVTRTTFVVRRSCALRLLHNTMQTSARCPRHRATAGVCIPSPNLVRTERSISPSASRQTSRRRPVAAIQQAPGLSVPAFEAPQQPNLSCHRTPTPAEIQSARYHRAWLKTCILEVRLADGMSYACCRPRHAPTLAVFSAARLRPAVGKPAYWGVPAASAATVPGSPARSSPSAAVSRPPTDLASGPFCAGPIPVPVLSHKLR